MQSVNRSETYHWLHQLPFKLDNFRDPVGIWSENEWLQVLVRALHDFGDADFVLSIKVCFKNTNQSARQVAQLSEAGFIYSYGYHNALRLVADIDALNEVFAYLVSRLDLIGPLPAYAQLDHPARVVTPALPGPQHLQLAA